jgi:tetratricopeptide (TPR) repeat protein
VKGRKIFGDLVPFGKVWRTGANSATTITFGDDVTIGGTLVKAGTYGLLTIPDKDNWTIIISNQTDVTSPAAYKPEEDVVRVNVKPYTLPYSEETFTINVYNIKDNSCTIGLVWDNQYAGFDVTTDIDSKIMADIKRTVEGDTRPYFQAAMYYMNNGKDLNQALTWFNKAAELQPTAYFIIHQQANCLAKLGKKEEAKAAAKKSMALAKEAKNDDYVRLNEKLLAELNK